MRAVPERLPLTECASSASHSSSVESSRMDKLLVEGETVPLLCHTRLCLFHCLYLFPSHHAWLLGSCYWLGMLLVLVLVLQRRASTALAYFVASCFVAMPEACSGLKGVV